MREFILTLWEFLSIIIIVVALVSLIFKEHEKQITQDFKRQLTLRTASANELQKIYEKKFLELQDKEKTIEKELSSLKLKKAKQAKAFEDKELQLKLKQDELIKKEFHINTLVRQELFSSVLRLSSRDYLLSSPSYFAIRSEPDPNKFASALSPQMKVLAPFDISARVSGESGSVYDVTLYSCTCKDFSVRKTPCKHMYRLAVEVGALLSYNTDYIKETILSLKAEEHALEDLIAQNNKVKSSTAKAKKDVEKILQESSQAYPWIAKLFADYHFIQDKASEAQIHSTVPKSSAADQRKRLIKENRELRAQSKMYEYQLHFYETIFPWLEEFKELSPQDAFSLQTAASGQSEYDTLRNWLSPEEYNSLSVSEKYQLALDRYQSRKKTNWEIGIEYERYIGYLCEQQNYHVTYTGANLGLEDMGRDLILSKNNSRIVIQCKRWSQEKTIHEKHIFQLFGSCILLEQQLSNVSVSGVFVTTAALSDTARSCASRLNIQVYENFPMQTYPLIKCNISRAGEKIYHLPFDQQYDRIVIDSSSGEFYADSVPSAEAHGFRRALRHISSV